MLGTVWRNLLEQCSEAVGAYAQALTNSSGLIGAESDQALQRAEEVRDVSQTCETDLLSHEQMHDGVRRSAVAKAS
jgi:hypothetical protein